MLTSFSTWDAPWSQEEGAASPEGQSNFRTMKGRVRVMPDVSKRRFEIVLDVLEAAGLPPPKPYADIEPAPPPFPWQLIPTAADPAGGKLNSSRAVKKRGQVESMFQVMIARLPKLLSMMVSPEGGAYTPPEASPVRIVDFGSSSGVLCLPLAVVFPQVDFVCVEIREECIRMGRQRTLDAGLSNVRFFHGRIEDYDEVFDVGLALHACGGATDLVLDRCLEIGAVYCLASCCVGKLQHLSDLRSGKLSQKAGYAELKMQEAGTVMSPYNYYPRSPDYRAAIDEAQFIAMSKVADTNSTDDAHPLHTKWQLCKTHVEMDRNALAKGKQYATGLYKMSPLSCSPKNDIIVGLPPSCRLH